MFIESSSKKLGHEKGPTRSVWGLPKIGAPGGIRTPNLLIRSQMLYPLSYGRIRCFAIPIAESAFATKYNATPRPKEGKIACSGLWSGY